MSYTGFVCEIKNLRNHPNGDNLYLGECFGNTVAVSRKGYEANMIGVYFPVDGQLSIEFTTQNNLLRLKDENGHSIPGGGYMDPNKRNITAIKLRGEKSDGLFLPLSCLDYCFKDGAAAHLKIGDTIDVVNGHDICTKYIPRGNKRTGQSTNGNRTRKKRVPIAPLFAEHADTEQLAYNLGVFKSGDEIEITLKMHGTSQRTGYLPVFKGYNPNFWGKIANSVDPNKKLGKLAASLYERALRYATPIYEWGYVSGTRRTVLDSFDGGFYGSNEFREQHHKFFEGKLHKGEEVYYEVVGFTHTGQSIMGQCSNKKLNDKAFVKQYGETTTFSYGCEPFGFKVNPADPKMPTTTPKVDYTIPQSDIYVYRMTMTNEDGNVVEYTPDFMRYRCEQMGVKTVPVFWKGTIPTLNLALTTPGDWVKQRAEYYYNGPDPIGKTHIREGVVVRIINKPKFCAYKHKNYTFKMISGIISDSVADGLTEVNEEVLTEL